MLNSQNEWIHNQKEEISAKIELAFEQFERGDFFTAEESRIEMEKRKPEWLNNRKRLDVIVIMKSRSRRKVIFLRPGVSGG
jgi:hypothetical protein